MFLLDTVVGRVRVAFTDRHGGVSQGPWSSLNLAVAAPGVDHGRNQEGGADDPSAVRANQARLAAAFGAGLGDLATIRQVHGAAVAVCSSAQDPSDLPSQADALVSDVAGPVLLVRIADCVPVVLADAERGVAGVAHAGRRGLVAGVVPAAVDALRARGASHVRAWVGPRICARCYEVPAAMRAEVSAVVPATWASTADGTPGLDLGAGVRGQLERAGIAVHDLADELGDAGAACTRENPDLFSYRRQGVRSGRLGALVQVQP